MSKTQRIEYVDGFLSHYDATSRAIIENTKENFLTKFKYIPSIKECIFIHNMGLGEPASCKRTGCEKFAKFGDGRYNYCSRGCSDTDPARNEKIQEKRKQANIDYSAVHEKVVATKNIVGEDGLTTHERTGAAMKKRLADNPDLVDEFVSRLTSYHKTTSEDERKRIREKRVSTMESRHGRSHFGGGYSPLKRIIVENREFIVQGYEDVFLRQYEDPTCLICCNRSSEYAFEYEFNGNKHKYFPDFFDHHKNVFFEIKSKYWWEKEIDRNLSKIEAVNRAGREIKVIIYDGKEIKRIRKEIERRDLSSRETDLFSPI